MSTQEQQTKPDGGASVSTAMLERCGVCGEELFEHERDYCEDCRDGGDLEDVLERAICTTNI